MQYFTDGTGLVARVLTDAPFGREFSRAEVQTYSARRGIWKPASPGMTTGLQFGGDWSEITAEDF
ncbi:hypothetical protein H7I53_14520 [Mycolicibacterium pulveris]|uniref:Uncharacterized protein n=1 Tax=Mycolicibacterium pulveris TaxID=36813 RepID=A0A7I7UPL3_MYCPV|nr:hypothetical protein [Mycolicibacterium pulveris]MCV6981436.1 hypothetical protein [Mycolicibacterium pulveris]BBY82106.1 hypothetical protein MPUL_32640 [Mycolicibacterium pulveris]